MSWQRRARFVVAIVGIGCAASVYFLLRKREPPAPVQAPTIADPKAQSVTGPGDMKQYSGDKEQWRISYQSSAAYDDGRMRFTTVRFKTLDGSQPLEMTCDEAVAIKGVGGTAALVNMTGHVVADTSDKWHIETDSATYDGGTHEMKIPGLMTFSRDRVSGSSQGATYVREAQVLNLTSEPHFIVKPDATGGDTLDASALSMVLRKADGGATLNGQTRLVRDRETLTSDHATISTADDQKTLKSISLQGHAKVTPTPGAKDAPPEMSAGDIMLTMEPKKRVLQTGILRGDASMSIASEGGTRNVTGDRIDFGLAADGKTLVLLDARPQAVMKLPATGDSPSRTIKGDSLHADGDSAGLKGAHFDGAGGLVNFVETVPATAEKKANTRRATSRQLDLTLAGDIGSIEKATFVRDVVFEDGDVTAKADKADYFERTAKALPRLVLYTGEPPRRLPPSVVNGDLHVTGKEIDIDVDTHDLVAKEDVQTVQGASSHSKGSTGLFASDQKILGSAAEVTYRDKDGVIVFTGTASQRARVQQEDGKNRILAHRVTSTSNNDMHAEGDVESTLLNESTTSSKPASSKPAPAAAQGRRGSAPPTTTTPAAPGPKKPSIVHALAMTYTDAKHIAHYTGDAQTLVNFDGPDGVTQSLALDVVLDPDTHDVKTFTADGQVYVKWDVRDAVAKRLVYETGGTYVLTGPGVMRQQNDPPDPKSETCQWSFFTWMKSNPDGSFTRTGDPAQNSTTERSCTAPLQPIIK